MEYPGRRIARQHLFDVKFGIGSSMMEESAETALHLSHNVGIGRGYARQDRHVVPVDAQALYGVKTHLAMVIRTYAASGIQRDVASQTCNVRQYVVGASSEAFVNGKNGSKITFGGIHLNEFYGIYNPVPD